MRALLLLSLAAWGCASTDGVIRKGIENAATAVKITDDDLAESIPLFSELVKNKVSEYCKTEEECLAAWDEKMSTIERAVEELERAKVAILNFSDLYYQDQKDRGALLESAAKAIRSLDFVVFNLREAEIKIPKQLEEALSIMSGIEKLLKEGGR